MDTLVVHVTTQTIYVSVVVLKQLACVGTVKTPTQAVQLLDVCVQKADAVA